LPEKVFNITCNDIKRVCGLHHSHYLLLLSPFHFLTSTAASTAAPALIPTSKPSSLASLRAMAIAVSEVTFWQV
jgi:hypothetical protein